ncbi:hypothetical protein ARMGADRAFT_608875 [Armillaria gallica]|uniref:Uncharacterized protein n=1 Tax=Armillaria gallica TaxID=47427 RepID=A0A2H3CMV9_ARMGA|nr:hypothetical protein ARMGADRAFT_608875 [Armillaria gallica]
MRFNIVATSTNCRTISDVVVLFFNSYLNSHSFYETAAMALEGPFSVDRTNLFNALYFYHTHNLY